MIDKKCGYIMTKDMIEFLETYVGLEKKPVTSIFLSRKYMIPTSEASQCILEFYNKNKDNDTFKNLSIKYSICGKQKCFDKKNDNKIKNERHADILVKIVDKNELDETIKNVYSDIVSCQVYSIQFKNNENSLSNIIDICSIPEWEYNDENMIKCGILRTKSNGIRKDIEIKEEKEEPPLRRSKTEPKTIKSIDSKKSNAEDSQEKNRPVYVSRKATTNNTTQETKKPAYVSRKRQNTSSQIESTIENKNSKKAKTVIDEKRKKHEEEKKELERMLAEDGFSDDDFDDNFMENNDNNNNNNRDSEGITEYKYDDIDLAEPEDDQNENAKKEKNSKQDKKKLDSQNLEQIFSDDDDAVKEVIEKTENPAEEKPDVETYVDGDGYVVRKVNRVTSKPQSSTQTKRNFTIDTDVLKNSNNTKKQSNLMSFFKKK